MKINDGSDKNIPGIVTGHIGEVKRRKTVIGTTPDGKELKVCVERINLVEPCKMFTKFMIEGRNLSTPIHEEEFKEAVTGSSKKVVFFGSHFQLPIDEFLVSFETNSLFSVIPGLNRAVYKQRTSNVA